MNDMLRWVKETVETRLPAGTAPPTPRPEPDPTSPPPPPKPRAFGPRFWTGFGFGVLALILLTVAGFMLLGLWMKRYMEQASGAGGPDAFLAAPAFPAAGAPADYGLAFETLEGTAFDAATLRGRTVFLNYWATWCGPCRAEMPSIQRLRDKTKDLGVVFLLASDEKRETIAAYLAKNPLSLPVFRSLGSRPAAYRSNGIPATFILSADGRIAFSHVGAARWDDESTLAFLRRLAAGKP